MLRSAVCKFLSYSGSSSRIVKSSPHTLGINSQRSTITRAPISRHLSDEKGSGDGLDAGFRPIVPGPGEEPWIPEFKNKLEEGSEEKRSRLKYQSRKRGIAENGLLLGTFADKYLDTMSEHEMIMYDRLINLPTNDWDIYYWVTGTKPTPDEFDNEIMDKIKAHANNSDKESRISMPPLRPNPV